MIILKGGTGLPLVYGYFQRTNTYSSIREIMKEGYIYIYIYIERERERERERWIDGWMDELR